MITRSKFKPNMFNWQRRLSTMRRIRVKRFSRSRPTTIRLWRLVLNICVVSLLLLAWMGLVVKTYQYVWLGFSTEQNYASLSGPCLNLPSYNSSNYQEMDPAVRKLFGVQPKP